NDKNSEDLISEPVKCPFCAVDNFGITYIHPTDFKTGIEGNCKPSEFKFIDHSIEEENEEEEEQEEEKEEEEGKGECDDDDNNNNNLEIQSKISVVSSLTEIDLADPFSTKKIKAEERKKAIENKNKNKNKNNNALNGHKRNLSNATNNSNNISSGVRKRRESLPPDAPSVITIDTIRPDWEQKLLAARTKLARRSAAATALHATSLITNSNINSNHLQSNESGYRNRNRSDNNSSHNRQQLEEMLIEEAMRLSLLDEEERKM
ncbi:hypothetical protein C6P40_004909, partial [Pichia californica]